MFVENKDAILMMRSVYTICVSHYVTLCHTHIVTRFIYASLSVLNPKSVYARLRVGLNGTTILLSPGGTKFSLSPLQSSHKIVRDVAARARIALKLPERTW